VITPGLRDAGLREAGQREAELRDADRVRWGLKGRPKTKAGSAGRMP